MFVFKSLLFCSAWLVTLGQNFNGPTTTPVPILKQINRQNDDGSYSYGYEAADGSFKIETKHANGDVAGKYGYIDESGQKREISYGASSKRGFEPEGFGIMVPPSYINESPSNALTDGQEDDGQYREDPTIYEDPKYNNRGRASKPQKQFLRPSELQPQAQYAREQYQPQTQQYQPQQYQPQQYQPQQYQSQQYQPQTSQFRSTPLYSQQTSLFNQGFANQSPQQYQQEFRPQSQIFHQQPQFSYQAYTPQNQNYQNPQVNYQNPHQNFNPFSGHPAQNFDPSTGSYTINFTGK